MRGSVPEGSRTGYQAAVACRTGSVQRGGRMGPRRRQLGTAFAFVVTAAALAACGGGGSAETVDAALVCDDIAVLDESIQALEDLVPATATVEDYRDAWDTIEDAYQVVIADREALSEANATAL